MHRRKLLLLPLPLLGQRTPRISVGCQTNAWRIDSAYTSSVVVWSQIRELGYTGMETGYRDVEPHFARGGEIGPQLRRMGLRLYGVHLGAEQVEAATGLPPGELTDRVAKGAAAIGAERLIVSGAVAKDFLAKAAALKSLEAYCRRLGIRLAYQNQMAELEGADAELPRLMKKTRDVEYLMDWGHAWRAKADLLELFKRHRDAMGGMHFRDYKGEVQVPLGTGEVDYGPLARAIVKADWSGWVLAAEPTEAAAKAARQYFRRFFGV